MATKQRKLSPKQVAKALDNAAREAESLASRLDELDLCVYAETVRDAASRLADAQDALKKTLP